MVEQDVLHTLVKEFVKANQGLRRALEDLANSLTEWEETHETEKKFPKPAKFYDYFYIPACKMIKRGFKP